MKKISLTILYLVLMSVPQSKSAGPISETVKTDVMNMLYYWKPKTKHLYLPQVQYLS